MPAIDTQHGKKAPPRSKPRTRKPTAAETLQAAARLRRDAIQHTIETKADQATTRRQSLAAERGYRSQGRAVRLAASPRARRADTRARQLREIRAHSKQQEAAYRSQGAHVELSAALQKLAREGLASAAKGTIRGPRAFGVKVGRDRSGRELVMARTPKSFGRRGGRELSLIGKTPSELAEIVDAVTEKRWNGTLRVRKPDAALKGLRKLSDERLKRRTEDVSAPARKALDLLDRSTNIRAGALAGGLKGLARGGPGGALIGAVKGGIEQAKAKGKARKNFKQVIGVKGPVGSALGVLADIGTDPFTYATLGTSSVARVAIVKSAKEAAKQAERAALKAAAARGEITAAARAQARERARSAYVAKVKQETRKAELQGRGRDLTRGVDVRFAGVRVPGVMRATAGVRHGASKAAGRVAERAPKTVTVKHAAQNVGAQVNANVRRAGQTKAQQAGIKGLQREARSDEWKVINQIQRRLKGNLGRLKDDEGQRVMNAIENQRLDALKGVARPLRTIRPRRIRGSRSPDRLFTLGKRIDADLKYLERVGRRTGDFGGGRVGVKSRTRRQVELAGHRPTPRSGAALVKVQQELNAAGKELSAARKAQQSAAKPSDRIAARRRATAARQRFDNLTAKRDAMRTQRKVAESPGGPAAEHAQIQRERFGYKPRETKGARRARRHQGKPRADVLGTEARGYFPRLTPEEVKQRTMLDRLAAPLHEPLPTAEQIGADNPQIGAGKTREHRGTRAQLARNPETADIPANLSTDVLKSVGVYAGSVARSSAARNLNTKLVQEQGEKLPRDISPAQIRELHRQGKAVYRVKGGTLQELADSALINAVSKRSRGGGGGAGGGQVAVLDRAAVAQARGRLPGATTPLAELSQKPLRGFKTVALTTPAYLVRNLLGDTYNALGDERFWRLAANQARSHKVLNAVGRKERRLRAFQLNPEEIGQTRDALRKFRDWLPGDRHSVKLTQQQADTIAEALGMKPGSIARKVPTEALGLLSEQMGVIRQGRLVELATENKLPKGVGGFRALSQRVEDLTRLATFIGGLRRGLDPREAAQRVMDIHFDYNDLTYIERNKLRTMFPFYTFTARNVPLQLKRSIARPRRVTNLAAGINQAASDAGLGPGYSENQTPYEQRQLGFPIRWGTNPDGTPKIFTLSAGLPFTDLNDIVGVAEGAYKATIGGDPIGGLDQIAFDTVGQRAAEMFNPTKILAELPTNHSFFYRDEIQPGSEPYTRAPQWAVALARKNEYARKKLGIVFDYQPAERHAGEPETGVPGWPRKTDYAFRNVQPGAVAPIIDLLGGGVRGKNARGMSKAARALAFFGLRAIEYDSLKNQLNDTIDQQQRVGDEMARLRRRAGEDPTLRASAENPTKRFDELREQDKALQEKIHDLNVKLRAPEGGLVEGQRVGPDDLKPTSGSVAGLDPAVARAIQRQTAGAAAGKLDPAIQRAIARQLSGR